MFFTFILNTTKTRLNMHVLLQILLFILLNCTFVYKNVKNAYNSMQDNFTGTGFLDQIIR